MENKIQVSELLMKGDCPYNYDCKDPDCMECIKIHSEERGSGDG